MESQPITPKPEHLAELADYARRHDQDTQTALDSVLADFFAWEKQDYQEAVKGIQRGLDDMKAGRTRPAKEFLEELREKHGFPR
jgi:predicted transcriptional regulator